MDKERIAALSEKGIFALFIVMAFFLPVSNSMVEIASGLMLFLFVIRTVVVRSGFGEVRGFFSRRLNMALLLFFLFTGLSLLASGPFLGDSAFDWIFKWGKNMLVFCFAQAFLDRRQVRVVLSVLVAATAISALAGLWQYFSGREFLRGIELVSTPGFVAVRSGFNHYNSFATLLVTMFFIVCGFLSEARSRMANSVLAVLLCMITANLLLTFSRGGWLAFVLTASLSVLLFAGRKERVAVVLLLTLFVAGIAALPVVRERFWVTFGPGGDASRFELWSAAFAMFKDSPVYGAGVGLFMKRLPEYSAFVGQYAHNNYLQVFAETGILGLGTFLWFLSELLWGGFKKIRAEKDFLLTGTFLGITAFLAHSFFDTQFYSLRISMLFWLIAGLMSTRIMDNGENTGLDARSA